MNLIDLKDSNGNVGKVSACGVGTVYEDIPVGSWSDTVDLSKQYRAIKVNAAGTYYILAVGSSVIEPWVSSGPEVIDVAVKRIGASTDAGLDGYIKGII